MGDFPTRTELFNIFADELLIRSQASGSTNKISPQEVFTEGSDINLIGAGAAAMGEEVVRQLVQSVTELTLDGASGKALDRFVADRFSPTIVRKQPSPAKATVVFSRTSTTAGPQTYEAGSIIATPGGIQFKTLQE